MGEQWEQLKKKTTRTADEEKQFQELSDQLAQASKGLDVLLAAVWAFWKDKQRQQSG